MDGASDMDQVIDLHEKFLDSCLKECLLASQDLLKVLTKLMTTCLLFSDQMKRFFDDNEVPDASVSLGPDTIGASGADTSAALRQGKLRLQVSYYIDDSSLQNYDSFHECNSY